MMYSIYMYIHSKTYAAIVQQCGNADVHVSAMQIYR